MGKASDAATTANTDALHPDRNVDSVVESAMRFDPDETTRLRSSRTGRATLRSGGAKAGHRHWSATTVLLPKQPGCPFSDPDSTDVGVRGNT
jgi:hypothetical protein